ncbi:DUF1295 domain-containing protein [Sphingomonas sp. SFZ2018-12]|uniref:methyltransferase family protein n=1 Tax=Sphingomonas sp. SFZ2018-12 TaxID=2683197 RepID=UPI001F0FE34E|nr:DUF1295 domain-containing protein [Sphingomonas sp. SFZ2018-12]MCH4892032.1 DUF1295 domain-containing protein [Sphingomonas sp. SFZ2018-12]
MYHDAPIASATADPRPASAVSDMVGMVGLGGLIAWTIIARHFGLAGPLSALTNVLACAVPMVLWSVFVDKVHRNPSTGIDWSRPRPWREVRAISMTKLAGLWLTWAGIAAIYAVVRLYWQGNYAFAMQCFMVAAPAMIVLSIPYVLWLDRYLVEPRDGTWALGAWLLGKEEPVDGEAIKRHLRAWAVKAFFLAFMLSIVPGGFADFVRRETTGIWTDPVALANWLITYMFVIDVAAATSGYVLTMRPLDAHIRTATPHFDGWIAALICYPPFVLMREGGPLDYHPATAEWSYWFQGLPWILWIIGALLVVLTAIYAWATLAFGIRFSNLTHRGILTHGPYAITRHPAYLSKNLFWWLATVPFFATTDSVVDAVRNTVLLATVSAVYYWRAKTEEKHLGEDPAYREYYDWMTRNGPVPRFFAWLAGRPGKRMGEVPAE